MEYSEKFYKKIKVFTDAFIKTVYRPNVIGKENLPEGKYILAGNHTSGLDILFLSFAIDSNIRYMAKKELFEMAIIGPLLARMGAFPINRNSSDGKSVRTAIKLLRQDEIVGIFPEGTRSKELLEFKPGVPSISVIGKCPVVPFGISGDYKVGEEITMNIGEPIYFKEIPKQEREDYLFESVKKLLKK